METHIAAWERKINSLSQEIAEFHHKITAEAEAERQRIIAHAQQEGEHIKKQAQIVAEQELIKAIMYFKKRNGRFSYDHGPRSDKKKVFSAERSGTFGKGFH